MNKFSRIQEKLKVAEFATAGIALWWALALVQPNIFTLSHAYYYMAILAPAPVWAIVALAIGAFQIVGMFLKQRYLRQVSLLSATAFWTFIAVMLLVGDLFTTGLVGTGFGTYLILGVITAYSYLKVESEFYKEKIAKVKREL